MSHSTPKDKAHRLKQLRSLAGLTAKELSERNNIPLATIKSWEAASNAALTEKGAHRVVDALKNEGVDCSVSWLLHGTGSQPHMLEENQTVLLNDFSFNEYLLAREREIKQFYSTFQNAITLEIHDDAMTPFYSPGDVIGAVWQNQNFEKLVGRNCIIKLEDQSIICRKLAYCTNTKQFYFYASHMDSSAHPLLVESHKPDAIAPVLRVWTGL